TRRARTREVALGPARSTWGRPQVPVILTPQAPQSKRNSRFSRCGGSFRFPSMRTAMLDSHLSNHRTERDIHASEPDGPERGGNPDPNPPAGKADDFARSGPGYPGVGLRPSR